MVRLSLGTFAKRFFLLRSSTGSSTGVAGELLLESTELAADTGRDLIGPLGKSGGGSKDFSTLGFAVANGFEFGADAGSFACEAHPEQCP